jgi:(p)ppGpp synthase/HD superfamily hydrolase
MNKKFKNFFLASIEIERKKRQSQLILNKNKLLKLWNEKVKKPHIKSKIALDKIVKIFNFAKNLNHTDFGSSKDPYFSHLFRVTCMALLAKKNIDTKLVCLALLHNVFETGNLKRKEIIKEKFGKEIFLEIKTLTVNRKIEWDKHYKYKYYKKINSGSKNLRIIKVLDKFDNLFLLDSNNNVNIKKKYINEIKKYILPMTKRTLPGIYKYYKKLTNYNYLKINNEKF